MKILATVQNKGGVGKTTVARLLAEWFGRRGVRTLVLDLDSQCNLSQRFLRMDFEPTDPDGVLPPLHPDFDIESADHGWRGRSSSADVYFSGEVFPYPTRWAALDILPGEGHKLREIEMVRAEDVKDKVHDRLRRFLSMPEVQAEYQLTLIDTSPSKGPLTVSAVRAATDLIIPVKLEPQSIEGLFGMLQLWRRENRKRTENDELRILCIQPNLFRKGVALHEGLLANLMSDESVAPFLAAHRLHQRIAFAESDHPDADPKSVFDLKEADPARQEAERFCQDVERRLFPSGERG
jgi:chromosome partitioning protein